MCKINLREVLKMNRNQIFQNFLPSSSVSLTSIENDGKEYAIIVNVRQSLLALKKPLQVSTQSEWKIQRKSDEALLCNNLVKYIIPVYNGLLLEVYDINLPPTYNSTTDRWSFTNISPTTSVKKNLVGTHIQHLLPTQFHNPLIILV